METTATDSDTTVRDRLAEAAERDGREVAVDETWVSVRKPGIAVPDQGWKLHISARPGTLAETLDRALPLLLAWDCDFKVARSRRVLHELNSGDADPATVGKAMTVYPPQDTVVRLGNLLAEALAGMTGPRITSDRRVRPDAPVYYRFAPFRPQYRVDENGDFELVVLGPDGEVEPGAAGAEFSCPPWASDPFRPEPGPEPEPAAQPTTARPSVLGGRYRLTSGVLRGPRGNVYRAVDPDGRAVVVKEARAYVGENINGIDLRMQLRNERRILQALDGVDGVPGLLDHFRHGEDEYLVITDAGTLDLNRYVGERTRFFDDATSADRDLGVLAARLAEILAAVHERGVVIRDLSPKNVVLNDDGRCTLIDFGNSYYDGFQLHGWTRGYSVPDQHTDRQSEPADDYFSLGATLFFAATGINPIGVGQDPARNLERSLLCLERLYPNATGVRALLPGLISLDPAERTATFADLRAGRRARRGSRPVAPELTAELLESVLEHTIQECIGAAERMAASPTDVGRSEPPKTNATAVPQASAWSCCTTRGAWPPGWSWRAGRSPRRHRRSCRPRCTSAARERRSSCRPPAGRHRTCRCPNRSSSPPTSAATTSTASPGSARATWSCTPWNRTPGTWRRSTNARGGCSAARRAPPRTRSRPRRTPVSPWKPDSPTAARESRSSSSPTTSTPATRRQKPRRRGGSPRSRTRCRG